LLTTFNYQKTQENTKMLDKHFLLKNIDLIKENNNIRGFPELDVEEIAELEGRDCRVNLIA
jgi:hypothetical protein